MEQYASIYGCAVLCVMQEEPFKEVIKKRGSCGKKKHNLYRRQRTTQKSHQTSNPTRCHTNNTRFAHDFILKGC